MIYWGSNNLPDDMNEFVDTCEVCELQYHDGETFNAEAFGHNVVCTGCAYTFLATGEWPDR